MASRSLESLSHNWGSTVCSDRSYVDGYAANGSRNLAATVLRNSGADLPAKTVAAVLASCKTLAQMRMASERAAASVYKHTHYPETAGAEHESKQVTKRRKRFDNKWSSALSSQRSMKL